LEKWKYAMSDLAYYFFLNNLVKLDLILRNYLEASDVIITMLYSHATFTDHQRELIISLYLQTEEVELGLLRERQLILNALRNLNPNFQYGAL
ncbi:hypothetical protein T4B_1144, partial [Trichinella pseudospiralis]